MHHVEHAHNTLVRKSSTEPQVRLFSFSLLDNMTHACRRLQLWLEEDKVSIELC